MTNARLVIILTMLFLGCASGPVQRADAEQKAAGPAATASEGAGASVGEYEMGTGAEPSLADMMLQIDYYNKRGEYGKAIEVGERALTKTKDTYRLAMIHFALSTNCLAKGIEDYKKDGEYVLLDQSIEHAQKYLEVVPNSWEALENIAKANATLHDWEKAAAYFSDAQMQLDPEDPNYQSLDKQRQEAESKIVKE